MKKKLLALVLVIALAVTSVVGGTLAYQSDSEANVNVMTLGNVDIRQIEQERNANGKLVDFTQNKALRPAVYSGDPRSASIPWADAADWAVANDAAWKVTAANSGVIDKFVTVKNTGSMPAYVRTIIAYEGAAINGTDIHIVHNTNTSSAAEVAAEFADVEFIENVVIDGVRYDVIVYTYAEALQPDKTTIPSLKQIYMDKGCDNEDVAKYGETYDVLVVSQAVQSEGWENFTSGASSYSLRSTPVVDVAAIMDEAFGKATVANVQQWMGAETLCTVATAEELKEALANGEDVLLTADMALENENIVVTGNSTINLNGFELSGVATEAKASNLIKVNSGATLTLTGNGTISFAAGTPDTNWGAEGEKPYPGYANNTISNSGKLIIDGPTVVNETGRGGASYVIDNYAGAELIVNSGVIEQKGGDVAIRMFTSTDKQAVNVTINGGNISGYRAVWMQLAGSNSAVAPILNLTVNGGVLTSVDENYHDAVYSYSFGNSFANTTAVINGGVFNGDVAFGGGYKGDQETVVINGGAFGGEVGRYVTDGWEAIEVNTVAAETAEDVKAALAAGKDVVLNAGEYVMPGLGNADGLTIEGVDGAVVVPAEGSSNALTGSINNVTIKNLTFEGSNAARWIYTKGDVVFEDCVFSGDVYGYHVDSANNGTITFNNCEFIGFNAFAATGTYYFNNCTFTHSGSYGHTNMWGVGNFDNCTFGAGTSLSPAGDGVIYFDGVEATQDYEF